MNSTHPHVRSIGFSFLLAAALPAFAFAQTVPMPADAKKTEGPEIVLSPFEVNAEADEGYAARETLAGTRLKSEMKDVASEVSIMTRDFLEDIASVSLEDAYRYSLNVENTQEYMSPTAGGGDFNNGVLNTRAANRIRGLTTPGMTHDFFQTTVLQDTYNIERASISSGPNAILFGNGNPGGIVDAEFIRANVQRAKYRLDLRTDSYKSLRTSFDLNQPIFKDRLALRLAAVKGNTYNWRQKPSGRDDKRYFVTSTAKPFRGTTVRAYFEDAIVDQTPARNTRFGDQVTPWIRAGRPAFNNGLTNPQAVDATNSGIFARETATNPLLLLGYNAAPSNFMVMGSAASASITSPTTRYSVTTIGPGSSPNATGVDSYIYSLPHDETISPFDVDVNGNGTRNRITSKIWGFSFEQDLTHGLYFEADYNRERVVNPISDLLRGIASAVHADANLFLPDRITPNPNFGRYYVESVSPRVFVFRGEKEESRAMLSYEVDATRRAGWIKWLGRHRIAGMYQRSQNFEAQQEFGPRIIPAGVSAAAALDVYGGPTYNTWGMRYYLSNPTDPSTGHYFAVTVPYDPIRDTTYTMPDGSTLYQGYKNPFGAQSSQNMTNNLYEGKVVAMQNYFLKDRLVTSFGWRRDNSRQAIYITPRKTAASNAAFVSIIDQALPTNWSTFTAGNTKTMGVVGHVFPWLSLYLNKSNTWNPPTGLINPNDGTQIPGSTGKGKDYGIMLRFFSGRLSFRFNKYENTSGPTSDTGFRNAIIPPIQNIENTLIDRTADGSINAPRPKYYDATQGTYVQNTLVADMVSKGYELEVVGNPTRNWRISVNGARAQASESNIGKAWIAFIAERASVWSQFASARGPGNDNTTIGTRYLGIIQTLNQMRQADGQMVEDGREWRANLVTRYMFTESAVKGAFVGGAFSWRSKQVIGYRSVLVDNQFKFAGAPDQVLTTALNAPIYGKAVPQAEAFIGYSHRLGKRVTWRGQLNVRNLLDSRTIMAQRANLTYGNVTVYTVPEPRSYILTNSFTF